MTRDSINDSRRSQAHTVLRAAMELVVFATTTCAPWAFGAVDPVWELVLSVAVATLLALYGVRCLLDREIQLLNCPVTLAIAGLFLYGCLQLVPWPSWLLGVGSPGTTGAYNLLLPAQPEVYAGQPLGDPGSFRTLSVYPLATRMEVVRLLAVLSLFVVVRNQVASEASLTRFAWGMLVVGVLVTLVGLGQVVSTSRHMIYWTYPTRGQFFGPFINRNHYADFASICVGLGIGLLLSHGRTEADKRARRVYKANALAEQSADELPSFSILSILHSPVQTWTCAALGILLAGVAFSLSRGGMVCLGLALLLAVAIRIGWPPKRLQVELLFAPLVMVVALVMWLGGGAIESRVSSLWQQNAFAEGRWQIWTNVVTLLPRFGLGGAGYGTTQYVEPISRQTDYPGIANILVDRVHNDYLEAWLEGGVPRLVLTLAVVAFLVRYGLKAMNRHAESTPGHLALGALAGLFAVMAHSFVEFGLSTPAVAVLAVVVAAQLCSLSRSSPQYPPSAGSKHMMRFALGGFGGYVGLAACLVLGALLVLHARQADRVERLRIGANVAMTRSKPADPERAIAYLQAAAAVQPDNAQVHLDLAQLHLDARRSQGGASPSASLDREHLEPAVRHLLRARNLNPFLPQPHVRLAGLVGRLDRADTPAQYYARAEFLMPYDADLWYFDGAHDLAAGRPAEAWPKWRKSLERGDARLPDILDGAMRTLSPAELLDRVLPPEPVQLLAAARRLSPDSSAAVAFAERGVSLLTGRVELSADERHARGSFHRLLGQDEQALRYYRLAVEPGSRGATNDEWHYELAVLCGEVGELDDADRELREVERLNPRHAGAAALRKVVARERKLRDDLR